ncbi:HdeD family acid-resistance protein [Coleofasciculus sp.]|uniref:HdeD family acid-resistance protein n=1 Tax=Coleofasciculus sp. TaxID=3100458 RepID=UPI003A18AA7B
MGSLLARNWWTISLRGAIALLFGVAVWIWPRITLEVLIVLFAAFALVGGVFALIAGLRERKVDPRWWLLLLEGVVGIATGIVVLVWPNFTALLLLYVIAAWAIITGIFEIIAAIQMRQEIRNEWLLAIAGIASVLFGLLLTIWPVAGALAILWLIGAYAIVFGILLLILGFRLRSWRNQEPPPLL